MVLDAQTTQMFQVQIVKYALFGLAHTLLLHQVWTIFETATIEFQCHMHNKPCQVM